jgi:hypothetical protein
MLEDLKRDLSAVVGCIRCNAHVPDIEVRLDAVKRLGELYREKPSPEIEDILIQSFYLNASLPVRIQAGHELGYSETRIMSEL